MTPEQQNTLYEKRKSLQQHLQFTEFFSQFIAPFTSVLESLNQLKIKHRVILARCIPKEFEALLSVQLKSEKFEKYKLSKIEISADDTEIERLSDSFPNVLEN